MGPEREASISMGMGRGLETLELYIFPAYEGRALDGDGSHIRAQRSCQRSRLESQWKLPHFRRVFNSTCPLPMVIFTHFDF